MAARKSGNAAIFEYLIGVCEARENGQKWAAVASLVEFRNDRSRDIGKRRTGVGRMLPRLSRINADSDF